MRDDRIPVVLVSAADCHLCERAREVLSTVSREQPLLVRELSWQSEEGGSLVRRDGVPFPPALYIGNSLAGYGRLSERALKRQLAKAVR